MHFVGHLVDKQARREVTPVATISMNLGVAIKAERLREFRQLAQEAYDKVVSDSR